MTFKPDDVDKLLAKCGRMCCICKKLHQVQVHHIVPTSEGGSDDIDNGITLCPNCHDEVHLRSKYNPGCTSRLYSVAELKVHRDHTMKISRSEKDWRPGSDEWSRDRELILFYAQCLDRPAFRTYFHQEVSFTAFDSAMADTITAINTGCSRIGESTLQIAKGKVFLVNRDWREAMDRVAEKIEQIRALLRDELGLNEMLMHLDDRPGRHARFRRPSHIGDRIDHLRQEILDDMNAILKELKQPPLKDLKSVAGR